LERAGNKDAEGRRNQQRRGRQSRRKRATDRGDSAPEVEEFRIRRSRPGTEVIEETKKNEEEGKREKGGTIGRAAVSSFEM